MIYWGYGETVGKLHPLIRELGRKNEETRMIHSLVWHKSHYNTNNNKRRFQTNYLFVILGTKMVCLVIYCFLLDTEDGKSAA